jgi:hypothetical protein
VSDDVMIAVDPHKASNTAAVLDPVTKTLIETARFTNGDEGYGRLTAFAGRWEQRRWAVEGCHGAGRSTVRTCTEAVQWFAATRLLQEIARTGWEEVPPRRRASMPGSTAWARSTAATTFTIISACSRSESRPANSP